MENINLNNNDFNEELDEDFDDDFEEEESKAPWYIYLILCLGLFFTFYTIFFFIFMNI